MPFFIQPVLAQAPPDNDNFASRIAINLLSPTVNGSNVGATREPGEPTPVNAASTNTVWWSWTAPVSGHLQINTIGSPFDTVLAIYTGTSVTNLTLIGQDDDSGGNHDSLVGFNAVAGTEYEIQVDGYNTAGIGSVTLTVDALPAITGPASTNGTKGLPLSFQVTTHNSPSGFKALGLPTGLAIDPTTGVISGTPAIPGSFSVSLSASNAFGPTSANLSLAIDAAPVITSINFVIGRTGDFFSFTPFALNTPAAWGAAGLPAPLVIDGSSGTISGTPGTNGIFTVTLFVTNATAIQSATLTLDVRPDNDDFATAFAIVGTNHVFGSNNGATREPGEPVFISGADAQSIWWKWTSPATGVMEVDTIGTPFDTILGAFTGNTVSNLTLVASDDDSGGNHDSLIAFTATAGTTYYFCVNGYHTADANQIALNLNGVPPITSPTSATGTLGLPFSYTITAGNSPTGYGAVGLPAGLSLNTINGLISGVLAANGPFLVTLYATNGFGVGSTNLSLTIDTAPAFTSTNYVLGQVGVALSFQPTALNNPLYWFASGLPPGLSLDGPSGVITGTPLTNGFFTPTLIVTNASALRTNLLTVQIRPTNDDFTAAAPIVGTNHVTGSNAGATREFGEPVFISGGDAQSVWWSWAAPASGTVRVDTVGTPFDTILAVFTGPNVASLTLIGSDDDSGGNHDSLITFNAAAGATYYFCVNGYHTGDAGIIQLNLGLFPLITSATNAHGTANLPFTYSITAINNPTNFGVIGLPAGLSLNTTSGVISGAALNTGTNIVTLFATNYAGFAATNLTLGIDSVPVITSPLTATGTVGVAFTYTFTAVNNPTNFSVALPPGLSLDPVSGVLSGIPTSNSVYSLQCLAANTNAYYTNTLLIDIKPVNDDFVNRIPVILPNQVVAGSNFGATTEPGEPSVGGTSVWWTWTATGSGPIRIFTIGSDFDTVLGIYTGSSVGGLTLVASDDDSGGNHTSLLTLNAVLGTTYQIAVDGFSGKTGHIQLTVNALPTILNSTNASAIVDIPFALNIIATNNPTGYSATGLPAGLSCDPVSGLISGTVTSVGTNFVTLYATNNFGAASLPLTLASVPNVITNAVVLANVGVPFTFNILAANSPTGYAAVGLPAGLNCNPVTGVITGTPIATGTNVVTLYATNGIGFASGTLTIETLPLPVPVITSALSVTNLVFQSFNYTITASYAPSSFNALGLPPGLGVNTGSGLISGAPTTNGVFLVTLLAHNTSGTTSNLLQIDIRPANDDFAAAVALPVNGVVHASNAGATAELGEPSHAGSLARHSVWYSWSTPTNCAIELSTLGSGLDTVLAVYTGAVVGSLAPVVSNDDTGSSSNSLVIFNASSGVNYMIAVDGYGGNQGPFNLNVSTFGTVSSINTAPLLSLITNRTVNPGALLIFTNNAIDSDTPAQTLTYTLDPGAPLGAAVDPFTGVFTWRPGGTQAASTNPITVRVTDNGTPPLSDFRQFNAIVNPLSPIVLTALLKQPSFFRFQFTGDTNVNYAVQTSTTLAPGSWTTILTTNLGVSPTLLTHSNVTAPFQFYRIQVLP